MQGYGVDEFPGDADSDPPESTPTPTPESTPALYDGLTLAGKLILVIFQGTRGEGFGTTPVPFRL